MKKQWIRWSCFIFLICVALMIFWFSSQNGEKSGDSSDGLAEKFLCIIGMEEKVGEEKAYVNLVMSVGNVLRKLAHFTEYFVLGIASFGFFVTFSWKRSIRIFSATAFCVLYAVSDELHQYIVPGRHASVFDVLLDSFGALCGIFFLLAILFWAKTVREKKKIVS